MGLTDLVSFSNLAFSAILRTESELLEEEDKRDFDRPKAMMMSIAVSIMWTSRPSAIMSLGRDLSMRMWGGSMRMLDAGTASPLGFGLERTSSLRARLTTSRDCSLLPSPPHLPKWPCYAKILSILDLVIAGFHRGAMQQAHIPGRVSTPSLT